MVAIQLGSDTPTFVALRRVKTANVEQTTPRGDWMAEDLFESYMRFGDRVWEGLDRHERPAQKFKFLLGIINQTLIATHTLVIARLRSLQEAKSVEDAKAVLEQLRLKPLTEAFRVEGMCDLLEGLGQGLLLRVHAAPGEGAYSAGELVDIEAFANRLILREDEVATLYSETLSALTSRRLDQASLPKLQADARTLEHLLTDHLSDFKSKADRFTRLATT
jgi:hypothetical protein